jgi:hypothetical protein
MLRELPKIVQMALQVIIDAFDIYLCVDMDEKVAKPCHLHQRVGKRGWKGSRVPQEFNGLLRRSRHPERQVCHEVLATSMTQSIESCKPCSMAHVKPMSLRTSSRVRVRYPCKCCT